MTTGKTITLTRRAFVGKVLSLLFNMLSRFVIAFISRSKHLLISWWQSLSSVILELKKIKSVSISNVSPSICHKVMLGICFINHGHRKGFPGGSDGKESACIVGDLGSICSIPWIGRSPEEGMAPHYTFLAWKIPMDKEAWQATVHDILNHGTGLSD